MLQLPIPAMKYNVSIVNRLIRHEYVNLITNWSIEPSCMISWRTSFFLKGPLTCKIFIAEKGSVLLVEKLCGTLSCKQWLHGGEN